MYGGGSYRRIARSYTNKYHAAIFICLVKSLMVLLFEKNKTFEDEKQAV